MKKRIFYLSVIFLLLSLISIYFLNRFNRDRTRAQIEDITIAEGVTIRSLIEISGAHVLEKGEEALQNFLQGLYQNELIVYIGLFKEEELVFLLSRYEGYFPVLKDQESFAFLDSPIGRIFNIRGDFKDKQGKVVALHIGFNYEFLPAFEKTAGRNFLVVAVFFLLIFLLLAGLIIYFDRKFLRKELELQREKQEKERFKELSVLTAEIAHEIKNPLNSLYLSFNALEKFISDKKDALFYRGAIKSEVKRINGIIQSYSDLSKEIKPRIEAVDIGSFVAEFRLFTAAEIEKNGAVLQTEVQQGAVFGADPGLLKQVLFNLVNNSLEAGAKTIKLDFALDKNGLKIRLKDDGRGIPEKIAADVFKPYVSGKTKGMGLGLHIVLKVLKALNGKIELVSGVPGDTVFEIKIPPASGGPTRVGLR